MRGKLESIQKCRGLRRIGERQEEGCRFTIVQPVGWWWRMRIQAEQDSVRQAGAVVGIRIRRVVAETREAGRQSTGRRDSRRSAGEEIASNSELKQRAVRVVGLQPV